MKFRVTADDPKWAPQAAVAETLLNYELSKPGAEEKLIRKVVKAVFDQKVKGTGYMKLKRKGKR